jgi:ERO1-like protein beta
LTTAPLGGALGQGTAEMCVFERNDYDSERDYCIPEDESASEGVYVSLVNNPERFTGYAGDHAHAIWREIYRENCFQTQPQGGEEEDLMKSQFSQRESAKSDLEAVMSGRTKNRMSGTELDLEYNQLQLDNTCLEKRVFWRLISGMHTSISTHLCWDYLNQTTGEWVCNSTIHF